MMSGAHKIGRYLLSTSIIHSKSDTLNVIDLFDNINDDQTYKILHLVCFFDAFSFTLR